MKKIAIIFGLMSLALAPAFAQTEEQTAPEQKKGSYLGVDNDEKEYLVGAPADNWFFGVGAGIQTYIDNQVEKSAIWNPITPAVYVEVGKWLIPDLAVSLQLSGINSVSQTRYSLNPFTDYTGVPNPTGNLPWHQINFFNFALNGNVILDWTNMCLGYEKGSSKKVHILTPLGLGCAWVTGKGVNKNPKAIKNPSNFELDFSVAFIPMITLSENIRLVPAIRLQAERGSLNYGAYFDENVSRHIDFQPYLTLGLNFNLSGTKEGATHPTRYKGDVATQHVFVPVENSYTMEAIYDKIAALKADNAALQGANDDLKGQLAAVPVPVALAADQEKVDEGAPKRALNAMEEILVNADESGTAIVYFPLNSDKLDYNADMRLRNFAEIVKNSDEDTKYFIVGAADSATGTEKINNELSIKRCKAVYNKLVKDYGVYPGKLEMRPLGGIDEYGKNELNRLGLAVRVDAKMAAIVDKYSKKY